MTPTDAPLRILHVLSHDRLQSGGAIQAVLLMRAQRRRGHAVSVAFNLGRDAVQARAAFAPLRAEGFSCHGLAMQHLRRFLGRAALRDLLRDAPPDVVHVHRERALRFALPVLERRPVPALVAQKGNCYRSDRATARAFRSPRVDRIVAVAHAVKRVLVLHDGVPPEKVEVIYGSLDRARFAGPADGRAVKAELGLPAGAPVVGILANVDRKKGHGRFFAAAARVLAARPEARFLVVGGGDVARGRALAERHGVAAATLFTGFREDPERMLAAFDVSVNCSADGEGLTGALRESLALSRPVVCTNVAGNAELIVDGETGWLVAAGDDAALGDAILDALSDPARAGARAAAGRARVLELMDDERRADHVLALYREVVGWRRARRDAAALADALHPRVATFRARDPVAPGGER